MNVWLKWIFNYDFKLYLLFLSLNNIALDLWIYSFYFFYIFRTLIPEEGEGWICYSSMQLICVINEQLSWKGFIFSATLLTDYYWFWSIFCCILMQQTLLDCRSKVCKVLGMAESQCELSMGMSGDFELAVSPGSGYQIYYVNIIKKTTTVYYQLIFIGA